MLCPFLPFLISLSTLPPPPPHLSLSLSLPPSRLISLRCLSPCGNRPWLADYRCVWCQKTAHKDCVVDMEEDDEECSMGPHQSMVVPPSSVTLNLEGLCVLLGLKSVERLSPKIQNKKCLQDFHSLINTHVRNAISSRRVRPSVMPFR